MDKLGQRGRFKGSKLHGTKARHEQKRKVTVLVTGFIAFLDRASRYPGEFTAGSRAPAKNR